MSAHTEEHKLWGEGAKFVILEIARNLGGELKKLVSTLTFAVRLHEITSWPSATSQIAEAQTIFRQRSNV